VALPLGSYPLHHIGYVVASIAVSMPGFVRSFGGCWNGEIIADPLQKVKVAFLEVSSGSPLIELVEPDGEDAPVRRFLEKNGGGYHHLCYEVGNLEQALADMKTLGAAIARRPKPAVAFGGRRIAWILTAEGALVELLEKDTQ
jgi:methylmalonyl-CoA/ethylmalonyl-CoA epimerase